MDLLFVYLYSYGHNAYSFAILVGGSILLWISFSFTIIPMDLLFVYKYSYGLKAYSFAVLVGGSIILWISFSFTIIPMDILPIPMRFWWAGPIPMALFLWT